MSARKSATSVRQVQIGTLIEQLGPLNNRCRSTSGITKVELLWDLGNLLLRIVPDANDALLWSIQDRSYITRNLLRYALIIRRSWSDRTALRRTFPNLSHYSLFREALPFLKDDRCGISDEEYQQIVQALNSARLHRTKEFLKELKARKIGRHHKKGQAVARMADLAQTARSAFKQLLHLAGNGAEEIRSIRESVGPDSLLTLSQYCMALAEDAPAPSLAFDSNDWPEPLSSLAHTVSLVSRAGREDRAGFRKPVGAVTLMEMADLANALRSEDGIDEWRRRRGLSLSLR